MSPTETSHGSAVWHRWRPLYLVTSNHNASSDLHHLYQKIYCLNIGTVQSSGAIMIVTSADDTWEVAI